VSVEIEPTAQHVARGAQPTLSAAFYSDGVLADPGVTIVTVVGLDGSAIVTGAATSGTGAAARTWTPAGPLADLDVLTVTWVSMAFGALTQTVEVVGDLLFSLREARQTDGGAMASVESYPSAALEQARVRISDDFERICGVAFMPRVRQVEAGVYVSRQLLLPDLRVLAVRSIETRAAHETAWTAIDSGDLAAVRILPGGVLGLPSAVPYGHASARVTYEHGWERVPGEIRRAALIALRYTTVPDNVGPRVTSHTGDMGTTAYATAGRVSNSLSAFPHYGIPPVDATLARYSERVPAVG
jgi:hypothetical protein